MTAKKSKGFANLTKKVLPENRPTSLAEFQNGDSAKASKDSNAKDTTTSKDSNAKDATTLKDLNAKDATTLKDSSAKDTTTLKDSNAKELNHRFTLYLTEDNLNLVEDAWVMLRRIAPKGSRKKITKSVIIDEAVGIVMKKFEAKGEKSELAVKVLKRFNT